MRVVLRSPGALGQRRASLLLEVGDYRVCHAHQLLVPGLAHRIEQVRRTLGDQLPERTLSLLVLEEEILVGLQAAGGDRLQQLLAEEVAVGAHHPVADGVDRGAAGPGLLDEPAHLRPAAGGRPRPRQSARQSRSSRQRSM